MAEWFKAAVLKTVDPKDPGVRIPLPPPLTIFLLLLRHPSMSFRPKGEICSDCRIDLSWIRVVKIT